MFNQETWYNQIEDQFSTFARNPWQDVILSGAQTVLGYMVARTLEPFLEAFHHEPIDAVLTLASITRGSGADHIVRRANQLRFQGPRLLERDFSSRPELCDAVEQVMVTLNIVHLVRQRLNSTRDEWLRQTLMNELAVYPNGTFGQIRRLLEDPGWKLRQDVIANLKNRHGQFSPAELILLSEALKDSSAEVRTSAARRLGEFAQTPPTSLVKTLVQVAIHDCDIKTRNAAARSLGGLRERIASPEILELLTDNLLSDDVYVRSATIMVMAELGEMAGTPPMIQRLVELLKDTDSYVREAAAHAIGRMGKAAIVREVMDALTEAMQDSDANVHEAALESLLQIRKLRTTLPNTMRDKATGTNGLSAAVAKRASANVEQTAPAEVGHSEAVGHSG